MHAYMYIQNQEVILSHPFNLGMMTLMNLYNGPSRQEVYQWEFITIYLRVWIFNYQQIICKFKNKCVGHIQICIDWFRVNTYRRYDLWYILQPTNILWIKKIYNNSHKTEMFIMPLLVTKVWILSAGMDLQNVFSPIL